MVSSPLRAVHTDSVDLAGLSIATANPSANVQGGTVYSPADLAGFLPVSFVPVGLGNHLMLSSQRWTAATVSATSPGYYSAYTVSGDPSWFLVSGTTGTRVTINAGPVVPMPTANDSRTLTGVESRSPHFFYALHDVVNGSTHSAVIQVWLTNTVTDTVTPLGEETVPTGVGGADSIVFSSGLYRSGLYMYLFGAGSTSNAVYLARKPWGQLSMTQNTNFDSTAPNPYWEFYTGTGWGTDPEACAPIQTTTGPLTTRGPISVAQYGMATSRTSGATKTTYMAVATVGASGSARTAEVYTTLGGRMWEHQESSFPLGSVGSTYMGGTLQFQSMLGVNQSLVDAAVSATAFPYVIAKKASSGSDTQARLTWGAWPVPRQK